MDIRFSGSDGTQLGTIAALGALLQTLAHPFAAGDTVGIKLHWGERGNHSFLEPVYAREIVRWLTSLGAKTLYFRHHRAVLGRSAYR